ncbi:Transient receptor potential cation channel subfamily A member 1-like [Stylophora pistillata]|uniref:Transient receptor potential cation channel subfamily A member 1-like n=1 Tax=Stylophora pistillata TaxID=50429 RepID=A0A2B4T1X4_STYPI|nr:Transient receptor potential cation channel subfamily A member 1-like [Stylophora pistillata]
MDELLDTMEFHSDEDSLRRVIRDAEKRFRLQLKYHERLGKHTTPEIKQAQPEVFDALTNYLRVIKDSAKPLGVTKDLEEYPAHACVVLDEVLSCVDERAKMDDLEKIKSRIHHSILCDSYGIGEDEKQFNKVYNGVILENEKAKYLINESDRDENTPLHVAAQNGYASVVQVLLDYKAKINARNEDQDTPLHLAAKHGKVRTVLELVKRDITIINDEDEASNTPLHLAAIEGHIECCRALLEKGAEVDARNSTLWTPLDCAAAKGHLKVAKILLDFDSPVDPIDKTKTTPLHLAAKEGHTDMVTLLLSEGADITLRDHSGRNCLDLAADRSRKETAMAIVNDENWMSVLKNKSWEQNRVTTPLRKLIVKLPSVAEAVFNRCVKESGHHVEDKKYEVTFDYEFLEDIYVDWSDGGDAGSETFSVASFSMEDVTGDEEFRKIQGSAEVAEAVTQLEKKESHPLIIMVNNKREQLLGHPLIAFLLDYKWMKFGRYIYYSKLAFYCLFLLFLTGYTVYSTEHGPVCANETVVNKGTADESSVPYIFWISLGRIVILALASAHILSELLQLFQLVYQRRQYFSWGNLLECSLYGFAIAFVADEFDVEAQSVRAFGEPGRAIVKTAMMMIGEFEFDDLFNSPDSNVPDVSWFIFIVFLIIMTLILMNLLIGLAVDDIKGVKELAVLERQAMLVDLAMDVERALPRGLRKQFVPKEEVVRPNQCEGFKGYWHSLPISARGVHVALKPFRTSLEVLSDRTDELQETVKTMQCKQEEMHKMLVGIVKKRDATVKEDDDD